MGVLNVTPDSFSDGGEHLETGKAIRHGETLAGHGADIIDVGGESTRPGSEPVSADVELGRVLPVVTALARQGHVVSIDTTKPAVATACLEAGAEIVNDIGGTRDPEMRRVVSESGAGVVVMHMQGAPATMQDDPQYGDVVTEVIGWLLAASERLDSAGVDRDRIVLDPGIGFGKTAGHNLELLAHLDQLVETDFPIMVGASRKAFLGRVTGAADTRQRDLLTAVVSALAVEQGVSLLRVHDVVSSRMARDLAGQIAMKRI